MQKQNNEFEHQLTILKGSTLVEELHGKEISYDTVMQAVEAISDRAEIPMLKYYKEVIKWYDSVGIVREKSSTEIYCEDERLSLLAVGVSFRPKRVYAPRLRNTSFGQLPPTW